MVSLSASPPRNGVPNNARKYTSWAANYSNDSKAPIPIVSRLCKSFDPAIECAVARYLQKRKADETPDQSRDAKLACGVAAPAFSQVAESHYTQRFGMPNHVNPSALDQVVLITKYEDGSASS